MSQSEKENVQVYSFSPEVSKAKSVFLKNAARQYFVLSLSLVKVHVVGSRMVGPPTNVHDLIPRTSERLGLPGNGELR